MMDININTLETERLERPVTPPPRIVQNPESESDSSPAQSNLSNNTNIKCQQETISLVNGISDSLPTTAEVVGPKFIHTSNTDGAEPKSEIVDEHDKSPMTVQDKTIDVNAAFRAGDGHELEASVENVKLSIDDDVVKEDLAEHEVSIEMIGSNKEACKNISPELAEVMKDEPEQIGDAGSQSVKLMTDDDMIEGRVAECDVYIDTIGSDEIVCESLLPEHAEMADNKQEEIGDTGSQKIQSETECGNDWLIKLIKFSL